MLLYRYQPINKFALENLILKKNWASSVKYFNDPFEFSLRSNITLTQEGKIEYITPAMNDIREGIHDHINKLGVVSYSAEEYNSLLWSHYSNNHKGMCLVFEIKEEQKAELFKVSYENEIPKLDFKEDEDLKEILITKSTVWRYENEYRQIFRGSEKHYIYPGELVEIIFGCQTTSKDIEVIFKIIESTYESQMTVSKMFIQQDTFLLGKSSFGYKKESQVPKWWDGKIIK